MSKDNYVIGVDYGTDSVRAIIVNAFTGEEMAAAVYHYPNWKDGKYCDPASNRFRQHPGDYLNGLEETIRQALGQVKDEVRNNIISSAVDTTGSTPVAVNREGVPLALTPGFEENPNAMFILWKDHTAIKEADEINRLARDWGGEDYTKYSGGIYSSEWFWAKILHVLREDEQVRNAAFSWLEHCDWIPAVLSGNTDPVKLKRSRCAAGHKAMWHEDFDGLPSEEFLTRLDPLLSGLRNKLYNQTYTSDQKVGTLCDEWASKLELPPGITIGAGSLDAHMGAIGGEIEPYYLSKVMGTSTCDMMIVPNDDMGDKLVSGIAGQVDGSILPGMTGLEAGQSAFGDIYAWYSRVLMWPVEHILPELTHVDENTISEIKEKLSSKIIPALSEAASAIKPEDSSIVALDWMNGRRTPDANQQLKGGVTGLSLGSDAPRIFRALVEATAFGSRMINERFLSEGIKIEGIIALGGVAKKSPFVMQIMADVLNMPIKVARTEQASALGSAMAAAVAAGIHKDFEAARKAMGSGFEKEYFPDERSVATYDKLFEKYKQFGEFVERKFI